MTDYQTLSEKLQGKPYLIADAVTGKVRLASQPTMLRTMVEGGEFPTALILNAGEALKRFARLRGVGEDDHEFTLKDIAAIAGLSYVSAWQYVQKGVIRPSIRDFGGPGTGDVEARFSWGDAFCAGIIGTLRRHRMKLDVVAKVQPLLTDTKKRTGRRRQPASRS